MKTGPDNSDDSEPIKMPIEDVLDLHTFSPKEIPSLLQEYLNACREANIYSVRIIHGKGKGFQKNRVRSLLKRLPWVESFSEAPPGAGGWGARRSQALSVIRPGKSSRHAHAYRRSLHVFPNADVPRPA